MKIKPFKKDCRARKARLQFFGACLVDSSYAWHIPATVHLLEYGAFLIMMIQRGMGLDAIVGYLEGYGIHDAQELLSEALESIPDGVDLPHIFRGAVQMLAEGVSAS